jgi:AcrR family transcriptional regulator
VYDTVSFRFGEVSVVRREARTEAILDATLQLIADTGYDRLTMDAVAARASASKATIYRRWQGKSDLVMAALSRHTPGAAAAADTGTVRDDLIETLARMRDRLASLDGALVLGLINAMRSNDELAGIVRHHLVEAKAAVVGDVVARAIERGELPGTADHALAAEIASALVVTRLLVTGQPLEDGQIIHLVDAVLLPVLTASTKGSQ